MEALEEVEKEMEENVTSGGEKDELYEMALDIINTNGNIQNLHNQFSGKSLN